MFDQLFEKLKDVGRVTEDSLSDLGSIKKKEEQYVADSFLNRKTGSTQYPDYWPVMPAVRVIKIWNDYAKEGFVRDEKGIDKLVSILCRAILRLEVTTELAGPTRFPNPIDVNFFKKNNIDFNKFRRWSRDKNGSSIVSDYAWEKLTPLNVELLKADTSEDKLQLIDRILSVVHRRGDLSKYFIEGGTKTLNRLANN